MHEAVLEELPQKGLLGNLGDTPNVGLRRLGELHAVDPLADEEAAGGEVLVDLGVWGCFLGGGGWEEDFVVCGWVVRVWVWGGGALGRVRYS